MRRVDGILRYSHRISAALLWTVSIAHAQNAESPTTLVASADEVAQVFWEGKAFYDKQQYVQALDRFKRAYALTSDADLLYDIAQTYRQLGQCVPALDGYREYLRAKPQAPLAAIAQRQIEKLQGECERASEPQRPETALVVAPSTEAAAPVSSAVEAPPSHSSAVRADPSENKSNEATRVLTIATLSGGVLAGGIAIGLAVWNENRYQQWSSVNRSLAQGLSPGEAPTDWLNRQRSNNSLARSVQRVDRETQVFSLGAMALIATSAVLYLWQPEATSRQRASARALDLIPRLGLCGARVACIDIGGVF